MGTTNPTSALHVIGDVLVTGVVTATTFNGQINSGVGTITTFTSTNSTITNLTNTRLTSGIGTINNVISDFNTTGVGTVNILNTGIGTINNLNSTILNVSGVGSIATLYSPTANINVGVITDITNTRLTSGIATITTLNSSTGNINNLTNNLLNSGIGSIATLYSTNAYINSGIVTDISGTNLNYTGVGTITNLDVTREVVGTSTITNLYASNGYINVGVVTDLTNTRLSSGIATITTLNSSTGTINNLTNNLLNSGIGSIATLYSTNAYINSGIVTNISGTNLNYTGVGTIATLNSTQTNLTNLNVSGISTFAGAIDANGGATIDNIQIGITNDNTIDTVTGNLTLDSNGGTVNVNDNLTITDVTTSTGGFVINAFGPTTLYRVVDGAFTAGIGYTNNQGLLSISNWDDVAIRVNDTETAAYFNRDGSAELYYDNIKKFETTGYGVTVYDTLQTPQLNVTGIGTITTINSTNIVSTNSDFINLNADNAYIVTGIITEISNSRLTSGIATITTLGATTASITTLSGTNVTYTNSDFTNLNANNANIDVGIVTDISGTRLTYTGVGTITTLDTDTAAINNLTSDYINVGVATATILNSGIGTIANLNNTFLNVSGVATITTLNSTNLTSTNSDFTNLNADYGYISVGVVTDISGARLNYTGVGTIATLDTTNATIDYLTNTDLTVTGIATIQSLDVLGDFDVFDSTATFHNNVFIAGNLSIGGTTTVILAEDLFVIDKTIVLGITTNNINADVSTDTSANGGGISIASTEGNPLVSLQAVGVNSLPNTHKKLLWARAGTYGVGTTDAWLFNYAVGIGSTLVPNDVRLAVGNVQITDKQINADALQVSRLASGIATITGADISNLRSNNIFSQSGIITDLSGTRLNYTGFGTITNLYSNLAYIDNISSNVGFATAFTNERLNVTGIATVLNLNVTNSTFTNLNTSNLNAVTGVVTTLTSTHSNLTNINSTGISTLNILRTSQINSTGVVTAPTFVGDLLGVANYAHVSGFSTFSGYSNTSGFSTFSGYANAAGVSTFSGYSNTSGFSTFSGYSNTSGFSTFSGYANAAGVATFSDYANNSGIATYAWTAGVSTYSGVAGYSTFSGYSDTTGFSTFSGYANAAGVSTFSGYANNAGIATYAWTAGVSTYSGVAGYSTFSGYSDTTGFSTFSGYANAAGVSTFSGYANASGVSTFSDYANVSGIATYAWTAGVSTYSGVAGVSTSTIGGLVSVNELNVSGVSTLGKVQITSTGIITSTNPGVTTVVYYGDGSNLFGVTAFTVESQPFVTTPVYPTFASNAGVSSVGIASTQVAYIPDPGYFGIGITNPQSRLHVVGETILDKVKITSSGIVTSSNPGVTTVVYYGDGSNLFGVTAFTVEAQPISANPVYPTFASNIGVSSVGIASTLIAFIPTSGFFGIGITNPTQKLDVDGNIRIRNGLYDSTNSAGNSGFVLTSNGSDVIWSSAGGIGIVTNAAGLNGQIQFNSLGIFSGANSVYYNPANDNLGINTSNPRSDLDVVGNSRFEEVYITGNVGVGTTSPSYKIDAVGDINITGDYKVNGNSVLENALIYSIVFG